MHFAVIIIWFMYFVRGMRIFLTFLNLFSIWCPLKGHTYLKKPAAFNKPAAVPFRVRKHLLRFWEMLNITKQRLNIEKKLKSRKQNMANK